MFNEAQHTLTSYHTNDGSFGHFQASRSGVHKGGLPLPIVTAGFVATRISVTSLNLEVVRALAKECGRLCLSAVKKDDEDDSKRRTMVVSKLATVIQRRLQGAKKIMMLTGNGVSRPLTEKKCLTGSVSTGNVRQEDRNMLGGARLT
eukprot:Gb_19932 [translate_table: standard]